MTDPGPLSPCTKLCTLDGEGFCLGCHRSIDEIARWSAMSQAERRQVLEAVERRRHMKSGVHIANE
jgi:predicted Fe-S protein YdhL (DUF1289 family)